MRTISNKSLVLTCDCSRCRSPGKQKKSAVFFLAKEGEKEAAEAAKRAGWRINADGFCIAPGHTPALGLEPQKSPKKRGEEMEIDY